MQHYNVVICTPGSHLTSPYVISLLNTILYCQENGISIMYSNQFSSHVGDAREATLCGSMVNKLNDTRPFEGNITYDKLMWIDSDISWTTEDFIKLYNSDKEIISGMYLLGSGDVTVYPKLLDAAMRYEDALVLDEPFQAEGVGFGFVCIKSGIFESMSRPWFQSVPITKKMSDGTELTFPIMGEDLSWCKRATDMGKEIWVDPSVKVTHHKTMKLSWEGIKN